MNAAALADIKTRAAQYTTYPIWWPNDPITVPEPPAPWIYVEVRTIQAERITLQGVGNCTIRIKGFLRVHVMVPVNTGADLAFQVADALISLLAMQDYGIVRASAATAPEIGEGTSDGAWNAASFSIPIWWDYTQ